MPARIGRRWCGAAPTPGLAPGGGGHRAAHTQLPGTMRKVAAPATSTVAVCLKVLAQLPATRHPQLPTPTKQEAKKDTIRQNYQRGGARHEPDVPWSCSEGPPCGCHPRSSSVACSAASPRDRRPALPPPGQGRYPPSATRQGLRTTPAPAPASHQHAPLAPLFWQCRGLGVVLARAPKFRRQRWSPPLPMWHRRHAQCPLPA